ncbi:hypothetical protein K466DRAFT_602336 [Polyporus arcularius HHB13444]|uniref:Secreted protein n=1 Tax=Polyporus arcularius HHB13444 TaxID=1314778 RepID=A0A5C3PDZ6_9APHY|nr:hypothetical protein K466DRAFT_602336 [Polyporus arcularius HHB13444]
MHSKSSALASILLATCLGVRAGVVFVNDAPTFVELTGCDHLPTIVYIPTATVIDESASCAGIAVSPSTVVYEPPLSELGGPDPTGDSVPYT